MVEHLREMKQAWPTAGPRSQRMDSQAPKGMEEVRRLQRIVRPYNGKLRLKTR